MKDLIVSIIIATAGFVVFMAATPLSEDSAGLSSNPALFPQLISLILVALGIILFVQSILSKERTKILVSGGTQLKVFCVFLLLILYYITLIYIGYLAATIAFLFIMMTFLGSPKLKASMYSLIISLTLYTVFHVLFKVPLPTGYF
ncbi:tripartite tricarboxylate transporter TctB family protein [Chromohalobacter japonicus]|nr:tripartite tricarboxylate transporter TctB family protein [Chromohalobacter japonicus]